MILVTTTNVSLDGVMQGLGGADEDRRHGFDRGGWGLPLLDDESRAHVDAVFGGASAFLFGRRTYEIFAPYWGARRDPDAGAIAAALNSRPKFVASATLTDVDWAGTRVLAGDLYTALRDLLADGDGYLLVPGSGELVRWLLANGLVDQLELLTYPVVVGKGARLFPDAGPDLALDLIESRATPRGVTIQRFRPAGRPEYAPTLPDPDA